MILIMVLFSCGYLIAAGIASGLAFAALIEIISDEAAKPRPALCEGWWHPDGPSLRETQDEWEEKNARALMQGWRDQARQELAQGKTTGRAILPRPGTPGDDERCSALIAYAKALRMNAAVNAAWGVG